MAVPIVTSLNPLSGYEAQFVLVFGSGFTGATAVAFDGEVSGTLIFVNDGQINTTVPPVVMGLVHVTVTNPDGTSAESADDLFTVTEPPPPDPGEPGECVSVTVGDFIADGATPDTNGIIYTVEDVGGWWDSIPVRSATLEAQPRGETITVAHEGGRALDVRITAHITGGLPLGNAACFAAMEAIKTAFRAVYVPVLMQVVDPSATGGRELLARRVGPIKQQILGAGVAVTFSIPMFGEDPRRFASP